MGKILGSWSGMRKYLEKKYLQTVCTDEFGITVLLMLAWLGVIFSKFTLITNW